MHLQDIQIHNFKSIRHAAIDCGRINIFLGQPNAGKSNILEALALLRPPVTSDTLLGQDTVRYGSITHLFHNFDTDQAIEIQANGGSVKSILKKTLKISILFTPTILSPTIINSPKL